MIMNSLISIINFHEKAYFEKASQVDTFADFAFGRHLLLSPHC